MIKFKKIIYIIAAVLMSVAVLSFSLGNAAVAVAEDSSDSGISTVAYGDARFVGHVYIQSGVGDPYRLSTDSSDRFILTVSNGFSDFNINVSANGFFDATLPEGSYSLVSLVDSLYSDNIGTFASPFYSPIGINSFSNNEIYLQGVGVGYNNRVYFAYWPFSTTNMVATGESLDNAYFKDISFTGLDGLASVVSPGSFDNFDLRYTPDYTINTTDFATTTWIYIYDKSGVESHAMRLICLYNNGVFSIRFSPSVGSAGQQLLSLSSPNASFLLSDLMSIRLFSQSIVTYSGPVFFNSALQISLFGSGNGIFFEYSLGEVGSIAFKVLATSSSQYFNFQDFELSFSPTEYDTSSYRDAGFTDGYDRGKADGLEEGEQIGYTKGFEIGEQKGYINGLNDGKQVGSDASYEEGKLVGREEYIENELPAEKQLSYDEGESAGLRVGYDNGVKYVYENVLPGEIDTAFREGKNAGIIETAGQGDFGWFNLFTSVIDVPVRTFTSMFDFEILGVNLAGFFFSILSISLVVWVVKKLL